MRPNIFDIATKELNQDAFVTWLLLFADKKYQSACTKLNDCGKTFVIKLLQKQIPHFDEQIIKVDAGRQWENIDVWAKINDKYLIVIEDKTNSYPHSNQLARYKETAEKFCEKHNYEKPICIYVKTENQSKSSLIRIHEQGFFIFSRHDFINLFNEFKDIDNDIFADFHERLKRIEKSNNEFENKLIKDWNGNDWQGFFQFLENKFEIVDWGHVNNPKGGFWNAVLSWDYWNYCPFYIQLEEGKLCFKISTHPADVPEIPPNLIRTEIRSQAHNLILNQAKKFGFEHIRRPDRFGKGNYMTVAIVDRENWLGTDNETIDQEIIIKTLTNYLSFLRKVIK